MAKILHVLKTQWLKWPLKRFSPVFLKYIEYVEQYCAISKAIIESEYFYNEIPTMQRYRFKHFLNKSDADSYLHWKEFVEEVGEDAAFQTELNDQWYHQFLEAKCTIEKAASEITEELSRLPQLRKLLQPIEITNLLIRDVFEAYLADVSTLSRTITTQLFLANENKIISTDQRDVMLHLLEDIKKREYDKVIRLAQFECGSGAETNSKISLIPFSSSFYL